MKKYIFSTKALLLWKQRSLKQETDNRVSQSECTGNLLENQFVALEHHVTRFLFISHNYLLMTQWKGLVCGTESLICGAEGLVTCGRHQPKRACTVKGPTLSSN